MPHVNRIVIGPAGEACARQIAGFDVAVLERELFDDITIILRGICNHTDETTKLGLWVVTDL